MNSKNSIYLFNEPFLLDEKNCFKNFELALSALENDIYVSIKGVEVKIFQNRKMAEFVISKNLRSKQKLKL